jgi:hypothetical protein
VSAGPCNLWCSEHGVERGDLERGQDVCMERMAARTGEVGATANAVQASK